MESRKRSDSPEDVSQLLAQLAEVHAGIARIQVERRRVIDDVQGRRGHARGSIMRVEKEKQRLIARRSAAAAVRDTEDPKLKAQAAALETEKASHVQQVEEYGAALEAAAGERARLRKEGQALEKKRADLAHGLPRVYARAYAGLVTQGIPDPIVDVSGGACVCGCAVDPAHEVLPTSCESCDRLLIAGGAPPAGGNQQR
jgi:predicted  nucleic acid-binding Zn-ribbon protein